VRKRPRIGDLVSIPWGLGRVDAKVLDVYDSAGLGPLAMVRVLFSDGLDDEDDPMITTVSVDRIEPAKAA